MMKLSSFLVAMLMPLGALAEDAPKPRTLAAAPIHGLELEMTISEAREILVQAGFDTPRINGNSRTFTTQVSTGNGATQTIGYISEQGYINEKMDGHNPAPGGVQLHISWLGVDPEGLGSYRRFEEDGRIWSIRRREYLETPSSYDQVMETLQEKFNFTEVDCSKAFEQSGTLRQSVHGAAAAGGPEVYLPAGVNCHTPMTYREVLLNVDREANPAKVSGVTLAMYVDFNTDGLVTFSELTLYSPSFAIQELGRFFDVTRNDLTKLEPQGSGLSDF